MPHTRSAAKRLRQNEKRRIANKARRTELKTIRKRLERCLHDGKLEEAEQLYRRLSKRLDQAASVRTIHKNTASRIKSRVALAIAAKRRQPAAGGTTAAGDTARSSS
ncbi:MAG: 30S ribosomal protein S20 [Planctomycetota bacterium]|nr:30S ribosomal protein S20 [Planctomycetota bacterium]MDW8373461.1 30S ribosomal protein S20 [Planctomycetota bacterium]